MKYPGLLLRLGLALILGIVMYAAAEADHIFDLYKDLNFVPNILISFLTVIIVMEVNHFTVLRVDRLLPFHRSTNDYYYQRYGLQLVLSLAPTFLAAISIAYLTIEVYHGLDIGKTTYFQYDIYLVVGFIFAWQIIYALLHWGATQRMYEEVEVINSTTYNKLRLTEEQRMLEEDRDYELLLLEVEEERKLALEQGTLGEVKHLIILTLEDTVDSIPLSDIAYFYTKEEVYFIRTFDGSEYGLTMVLKKLFIILPKDHFHFARPNLIVSMKSIKKVINHPNSIDELSADPKYVVSAKMSRVATRKFRDWEEKHPDRITW